MNQRTKAFIDKRMSELELDIHHSAETFLPLFYQMGIDYVEKDDFEAARYLLEVAKSPELILEKNLTQKVRDWVAVSDGYFSVSDLYSALGIVSNSAGRKDRDNIRQAVHSLKADGIIEKSGNREGVYRKINPMVEALDWKNAVGDLFPIKLPFNLDFARIFPKNLICLSGDSNFGKSAACFEIIKSNMKHLPVHYFSSEMGADMLSDRLKQHQDVSYPDGWTFDAHSIGGNYADAISLFPDDLNIIDYIELSDLTTTADEFKRIHGKLKNGVAVVLLQKRRGAELGYGGEMSLQKPVLYLSISFDTVKIIKIKSWTRGTPNHNGSILKFSLEGGWKFNYLGEWASAEAWEQAQPKSKKWGIG
jgi:hypothetical protein